MNDKELLELAAKAAGGLVYVEEMGWIHEDADGNRGAWWHPLDDDGDALRLAVKLNFDLWNSDNCKSISAGVFPDDDIFKAKLHTEWKNTDSYAATRRAIVRAAAEIGRMK